MDNKKKNPDTMQDAGQDIIQETIQASEHRSPGVGPALRKLIIPALAVFTGLVAGAILIVVTSEQVYVALGQSFGAGVSTAWNIVITAYGSLFAGALGNPERIISALQSGNQTAILQAFNPFLESLVASTPYIFAGLAVALGFRAGLFNIGVEGQLFIGATTATFVGYAVTGLPAIIHLPLTLLAGFAGGAAWGFIPGWLKAKTGGHEVINTIMLNWIAFRLTDWLLAGPMQRPNAAGSPISPRIQPSAELPHFFPAPIRFHLGFFIALGVAWLVWWFLFKTTWGYNLRTVGANPFAARYAGMNIVNSTVVAMTLSGGLAGLAGANQVLAISHNLAMGLSSGYGFDSIALALLGGSHPVGVVLAALLFGTLRNGATQMMVSTRIPIDIISILQAFILMFVAAPAIIRSLYRLRKPKEEEEGPVVTSSWGGGD